MRIDVEHILALYEERKYFNTPELEEMEFYYNGVRVEIPKEELDEFTFTGLSNVDFVVDRDWGDEVPEEEVIEETYVPANLNDAINHIMIHLSTANIEDINRISKDDAPLCIRGMAIRNDFNLWGKSPLSMWFAENGIYHADDMSWVISQTLWERVHNIDDTSMNYHTKHFSEYWDRMDCDVKGEFEKRCEM